MQPHLACVVWLTGRNNMEFLSEDIYGGYYSGLPEAQPWYTTQGLTSPYGIYGLNAAGLLAQQPLTYFDASQMDFNNLPQYEIPVEDVIGPTQELGVEDSIFQILMETIIGEQGIPEGVSPEVIEALRGDFGPTTTPAELQEVAIDIAEAGGFDEWLKQQDLEGPPEELPTELEEEVDIGADTTLEDEIGVEPDMPIDIPFPTLPPREEGEGDGEGAGESNGNGEGEQQETAQGEGDGEEYQFPDYPQGDSNYGYPDGLPGGGRGGTIYDVPVQEEPGFTIFPAIPSISTGGGDGGNGGGGGGGQPRGMLDPRFKPYMASIGYTPVAVPRAILPQAPIVSSLFGEYLK